MNITKVFSHGHVPVLLQPIFSQESRRNAEFELDSVREVDQDRMHVGATFTFVVTRQDHPHGRLVTELELLEPYLWQRGNEEKAARLVQEHFPSFRF
jgi:hypothetical protein